jgi:hypothetical protein
MKIKLNRLSLLTAGVACAGLIACGPPDKQEEESVEVDHATTQQSISDNTSHLASRLSETIAFLDDSDLWHSGVDAGFGSTSSGCAAPIDGSDSGCTEVEPAEPELDLDVTDDADEMTAWLEEHIFNEANVESEEDKAVTYLIDGDVFCALEGEPADPECVSQVNDAEIRLVATSPSEGDIDLDVLVGPNRANPTSLQLHDDLLAAEVDLGGAKESAEHIASITGDLDDLELPTTMEGRVRAELTVEGDKKLSAAFSVLAPIKVADGDFNLAMAPALPALSVAVDGQAKTIETVSNLGTVDGSFPVTEWVYEYDETTDTETETEINYQYGFHLGGLTSNTLFEAANDVIAITGLGLGDTTSTFSIDGEEVLALDLNADDGRTLDITATSNDAGLVDLEVSPKLDLAVALQFASAADKLTDVAEWMMDDVLRVTLDGADAPKVRLTEEDGLEVVDGTLTMSLANAGTTVTVEAGQCVLGVDDTVEQAEPGTDPEPTPVEETNPLEDLEAGTCQ